MTTSKPLLGGIELGGTKCICIIGTSPDDIRGKVTIPTTKPDATLRRVNAVFDDWATTLGKPDAIGLASFGPVDLRSASPTFGRIRATPKPDWSHTDVLGQLAAHRGIPYGFDTDVNAAAIAEGRWGAARGLDDFAYVTVGTGIGVGLIVRGQPPAGCNHAELGHIRVVQPDASHWTGHCPFHGDCLEGLASGPAIGARLGMAAEDLPVDSPVWEIVAHALAQLLHVLLLATAPRRVLMGGGVIDAHPELLPRMRDHFSRSINGYLDLNDLIGDLDQYVVAPGLGPLAGPLGALALAQDAWDRSIPPNPLVVE